MTARHVSTLTERCRDCLGKMTGNDGRCTRCRIRHGQLKRFRFATPERQMRALSERDSNQEAVNADIKTASASRSESAKNSE